MKTPEEILQAVSQATLIPVSDILGTDRYTPIVRARQLATFLLVEIGRLSINEAGRTIGYKAENGKNRYAMADRLLEHNSTFRDEYQSALFKLVAKKAA